MTAKRWAYEDLEEGRTFELPGMEVSARDIVAFAEEFDPQPMHLDEEAARKSLLGGLAASGWHSGSLFMRMLCEALLLDSTSQGSPGIARMRWKRPVLAGDTLSGHSTVLARRILKSRPEMGLVTFRHVVRNQRGETVMDGDNPILFRLRGPGGNA